MVQTTATFRDPPADCSHSSGTCRFNTLYKLDFKEASVMALVIFATSKMWSLRER